MAGGIELATAYVSLVSSAEGLGRSIVDEAKAGGAEAELEGQRSGKRYAAAFGGAAIAVGAIVGAGVKALFEVGSTFDTISDSIRVGTGKSGEALDGLVQSAKNVGQQVPADFAKIGPTIADLNTRLGLSGSTLETVASQYLEAGRILGTDVDVQSTTAAFSAFGIKGDAVAGAMDSLFRVSQATGVGFNDLAASVQSQAPALQTLGFNFEQTAGLIGNLDKAGLDSETVLASMGKGLVQLAKDGEEPQEAFQRVTGQIGDLVAAGDTAAALDLASGIFGTKGANQFVGAVQAGTIATGDLGTVAGLTQDTILGLGAETGDFAEKWELFKNRTLVGLEPLGAKVFGSLGSLMGKAANGVGPVIAKLTSGSSALFSAVGPAASAAFKSIGQTVGPVLSQLATTFGSVFTQLQPVFAALGPVIAQVLPLFNPFSLILHALLPVLPVLAEAFGEIAVAIGGALASAVAAIAPVLPSLAEAFGQIATVVGQALISAVQSLLPVVLLAVDAFVALLPSIMTLVDSVLPPLVDLFTTVAPLIAAVAAIVADVLTVAIQALMPVVEAVFGALGPIIDAALGVVKGVIEVVMGVISGDWSKVWDGIKTFLSSIWDGIQAVISGALDIIQGVLSGAWGLIKAAAYAAWEAVKAFIIAPLTAAWDWVRNVFSGIVQTVQDIWDDVKAVFTDGLNNGILNLDVQSGLTTVGGSSGGGGSRGFGGGVGFGGDNSIYTGGVSSTTSARAAGSLDGVVVNMINQGPEVDPAAITRGLREAERLRGVA